MLVDDGSRVVAVVAALELGVLAIAEPRALTGSTGAVDFGPLRFVEAPDLTAAVAAEAADFRVLTLDELEAPFDCVAGWPGLHPNGIRYWEPATVGEALFNYWD